MDKWKEITSSMLYNIFKEDMIKYNWYDNTNGIF